MIDHELLEAQKELLSSSYSKAGAYTNMVLGLGYAGFFGLWALTKEYLTNGQVLWSALLMAISLLTFILFEVYKSFYISQSLLGLERAVSDPQNFRQKILQWQSESHTKTIRFGKIWSSIFWVTVVTGIGGALILMYAFVVTLFALYAGG